MGGSPLAKYRAAIDALDGQIVDLLEQRAALAREVGEVKRKSGKTVYAVPEREAAVLRRVRARGDLLRRYLPAIYREIMSACLACEKPAAVAYLGPQGTYSHEAALKVFGHAAALAPAPSIRRALREVESGGADFAVLPFENSAAGAVGETMDALAATPLFINGENILRIRHKLLASADAALADIKEVCGHPQALEQCRRWLADNLPQARLQPAGSTAAAAALIAGAKRKKSAAVGSALARDTYGLAELADDIEDFANNSTRFLVLGRGQTRPSGDDKTSFIMTARDEAGAMYRMLQPLAENGVSMTKLESRPSAGKLWEYLFFVDVAGHQQDEAVARALAGVRAQAASLKILGSYPRAAS